MTRALLMLAALAVARPAPAQTVTDAGIDWGDPNAPVTVVEFADFGCAACAQFAADVLPTVERHYIRTGRVLWRVVPFELGLFRHSRHAAATAVCAAGQGEFWKIHDVLYQQRQRWTSTGDPQGELRAIAGEQGLELAAYDRCVRSDQTARMVRGFDQLASRSMVRATPTFFVNGRRIRGALPLSTFLEVLEEAAATAKGAR